MKKVPKKIPFMKFSGAGNDFIVVDNRKRVVDPGKMSAFVASARPTSAGTAPAASRGSPISRGSPRRRCGSRARPVWSKPWWTVKA